MKEGPPISSLSGSLHNQVKFLPQWDKGPLPRPIQDPFLPDQVALTKLDQVMLSQMETLPKDQRPSQSYHSVLSSNQLWVFSEPQSGSYVLWKLFLIPYEQLGFIPCGLS